MMGTATQAILPRDLITRNVNMFSGDLLLTCTYAPDVNPEVFADLSRGREVYSFCPELHHLDKLEFKLCTIFQLKRVTSVTVLVKDGSPHSMRIPLMVQEAAENLGFDKDHIRYFCLEAGELHEIADRAVRKARHFSEIQRLLPFARLEKVTEVLRGPGGCPNDQQETLASVVSHLREEIEEVAAAVRRCDRENLLEEIGDLLYNIVLLGQIAREQDKSLQHRLCFLREKACPGWTWRLTRTGHRSSPSVAWMAQARRRWWGCCRRCWRLQVLGEVSRQPSARLRSWDAFRAALAAGQAPPFDKRALAGLVAWDRLCLQLSEVEPALAAGQAVICERYLLDIYVFGTFRGSRPAWLRQWLTPLLAPDLGFVVDVSLPEAMRRLAARDPSGKRDEQEDALAILLELYRYDYGDHRPLSPLQVAQQLPNEAWQDITWDQGSKARCVPASPPYASTRPTGITTDSLPVTRSGF